MSEKNIPDLSRAFSRIPKVDSPRDLDRKILVESRRLAPERQGFYLRGWMPVTATVCMIGLAVFIAKPVVFNLKQPQRMNTSPVLQKQKEAPSIESFKDDQVVIDMDNSSNMAADQVMENESVTPETTSKVLPAMDMAVSGKNQITTSSKSVSDNEIRLESQLKKISSEKKELPSEAESTSQIAAPASVALEQDEESVGSAMNEMMMAEPVAGDQPLTHMELEKALEEIRKLIEEGKLDDASARLEELLKHCPGCDIPDSLNEF